MSFYFNTATTDIDPIHLNSYVSVKSNCVYCTQYCYKMILNHVEIYNHLLTIAALVAFAPIAFQTKGHVHLKDVCSVLGTL